MQSIHSFLSRFVITSSGMGETEKRALHHYLDNPGTATGLIKEHLNRANVLAGRVSNSNYPEMYRMEISRLMGMHVALAGLYASRGIGELTERREELQAVEQQLRELSKHARWVLEMELDVQSTFDFTPSRSTQDAFNEIFPRTLH